MPSTSPRVITKSDPTRVTVEWDDGHTTVYTARELRGLCPCAGCVDETSGRRTHNSASVAADLTQVDVALVGNYAITIRFSDGHATGIYTFGMLRENDPSG
ncbi:MAG: DUF971 domain-containing protein [Planctomycetota bacterium]|nr:DUF971 domain-containing protein [Planctomycetota bacterium]